MLWTTKQGPRGPYTCLNISFNAASLGITFGHMTKKKIENRWKFIFNSVEFAQNKLARNNHVYLSLFACILQKNKYHSHVQPIDRINIVICSTIIAAMVFNPAGTLPTKWHSTSSTSKLWSAVKPVSGPFFSLPLFSQSAQFVSFLHPTIKACPKI